MHLRRLHVGVGGTHGDTSFSGSARPADGYDVELRPDAATLLSTETGLGGGPPGLARSSTRSLEVGLLAGRVLSHVLRAPPPLEDGHVLADRLGDEVATVTLDRLVGRILSIETATYMK